MSLSPAIATAVADVRQKLVALEQDISGVSTTDAVGYIIHTQAALPYWVNAFTSVRVRKIATDLWHIDTTVRAIYHGWQLTEGQSGEAEQEAQVALFAYAAAFAERRELNSDTYPAGTIALVADMSDDPGAISAEIVTQPGGASEHLCVAITLQLTLEVFLEEGY